MSVCVPTEDSVLGQRAVADSVRRLFRCHVVHGDTDPLVHVLVVEDVMAVAKKGQTATLGESELFLLNNW